MEKLKKLIPIFIILIAITNIVFAIKSIIRNTSWEYYTNICIIIIVLQIITIIISSISLKVRKFKKNYLRNVLSIVILLISFFIPTQKNYIHPSNVGGLTPAVMPKVNEENIYGITIWSSN